MDIGAVMNFVDANSPYLVVILVVIVFVLLIMVLNLYYSLNRMQKKYKRMMTGVEDGANLERMLIGHIDETHAVAEDNKKLWEEVRRMDSILQIAVTRVGIVRFCAFEDMGSDLSYSVALLDSHDNGIVLSSLFGRTDSRSYAKPIENGKSEYILTDEEQQALREAMGKRP